MTQTYTLTEAKAKLSELINRVHFGKERFTITKKGKAVAVVSPVSENNNGGIGEGLIRAKGALSIADDDIENMIETIYENRNRALDREVEL